MIELNKPVFGQITAKEIIGEEPPLPYTKNILEKEFVSLKINLNSKSENEIKQLLEYQISVEKQVNSRPGAMALSQPKIRLYTEYSQKYIELLRQKSHHD